MAKVALENPRAQVKNTADGLQVDIRTQRKSIGIFMLFFWVLMIFALTAQNLQIAARPGHADVDYAPLLFPLMFFSLFFFVFIWMFLSKEQVRVNTRELILTRGLFGIGRKQEFDMNHVKDLRSVAQPFAALSSRYGSFYSQMGSMAFDYGSRTYRFGGGLDEAEAKNLVKQICGRFPGLAEKSS